MRLLIQHVKNAQVDVGNTTVGQIGKGLLVFVGFTHDDTSQDALLLKDKLLNLRIFLDENEKMNLSIQDVGGELLIVSQFTLYADCSKGRRPSFIQSARPDQAEPLYNEFIGSLKVQMPNLQTGQFGAQMEVSLVNDGPLTFWLDSKK